MAGRREAARLLGRVIWQAQGACEGGSSSRGLMLLVQQHKLGGAAAAGTGSSISGWWRRGFASLPPHTELAMPALSPTMTQGNIAKWYVKAGDEIAAGTVLADIETDKATLAFENQDEGFVAAILKPEGSRDVPVGAPVAIIVDDAADVAAFAGYTGSSGAAAAASSSSTAAAPTEAAAAAAAAPAGGSWPEHIPLQMPALSPTMERGNIVSWAVKEGDAVSSGTVLAEIETDKATLAFENQDEGFVAKILAPAGSRDVAVGQVVAIIVEDEADVKAFAGYTADAAAGAGAGGAAAAAPAAGAPAAAAAAAAAPRVQANFRLGPAARHALAEAGLSANDIAAPTGPNGIVTKADVAAAVAAGVKPGIVGASKVAAAPAAAPAAAAAAKPAAAAAPAAAAKPAPAAAPAAAAPAAAGGFVDVPNSQVRQIIAKRLLESKLTAPSLYVSADVALGPLEALRKSLAAAGSSGGGGGGRPLKLSVNDFVVRAVALALRDVPEANAAWDAASSTAVLQPSVDVCVAVATDGGLITPIVRGADAKPLAAISAEVRDLATRARANKLKPEEFMGGTFTVSNLGMFGLASFSAIINPPQAAILAVGGARREVAFGSEEEGGGLAARSVMTVTLTADERVIDGEVASRWLAAFKARLEAPLGLLA